MNMAPRSSTMAHRGNHQLLSSGLCLLLLSPIASAGLLNWRQDEGQFLQYIFPRASVPQCTNELLIRYIQVKVQNL